MPGGYGYAFFNPGMALSGFSLFHQGFVLDAGATNGFFASTDIQACRLF